MRLKYGQTEVKATPKGRFCGVEVECAVGGRELIRTLHKMGASGDDVLHDYHCNCHVCKPFRPAPLNWTGQYDCTVSGEIISAAMRHNGARFHRALDQIGKALFDSRVGLGLSAGQHVHVDRRDLDDDDGRRLFKLFVEYQDTLAKIAAAGFGGVRAYNSPFDYTSSWGAMNRKSDWQPWELWGTWLVRKKDTYEFRLWNQSRTVWRTETFMGLSVAMVEAACTGVEVSMGDKNKHHFLDVIGDYLTSGALAGTIRQLDWKD